METWLRAERLLGGCRNMIPTMVRRHGWRRRLFCTSEEDYVRTALDLASDPVALVERRAELSAITDLLDNVNIECAVFEIEMTYRQA